MATVIAMVTAMGTLTRMLTPKATLMPTAKVTAPRRLGPPHPPRKVPMSDARLSIASEFSLTEVTESSLLFLLPARKPLDVGG